MTKRTAIAIALNAGWRGFLSDMSTTSLLCPSMRNDLTMLYIFRASTDKTHQVKVDMSECIGRRFPLAVAAVMVVKTKPESKKKETCAGIGVLGNSIKQRRPRLILDLAPLKRKATMAMAARPRRICSE